MEAPLVPAPAASPGSRLAAAARALFLVAAAVLAGGLVDSAFPTGPAAGPASRGDGTPAPAEFVAHAVAAQCGLLAVMAVVLGAIPGAARSSAERSRWGWATVAATAAALALNGAGSWVIDRIDEGYAGLPDLRAGGWGVLILLVAGLSAPWIEELFFRETILARVLAPLPRGQALALSSLAFGALHLPAGGPVLFVTLTGMGAVFGWLRLRTGSIVPAVAAHAANNLLALALALAGGS